MDPTKIMWGKWTPGCLEVRVESLVESDGDVSYKPEMSFILSWRLYCRVPVGESSVNSTQVHQHRDHHHWPKDTTTSDCSCPDTDGLWAHLEPQAREARGEQKRRGSMTEVLCHLPSANFLPLTGQSKGGEKH